MGFRLLRKKSVKCRLNPGAVNGNFSPILESQLHTPGIHVKLAGSFIVLHNRILQFSLSAYGDDDGVSHGYGFMFWLSPQRYII